MREAAAAAFISVGCLYYYFPSKRSLVLFGLDEEAAERACTEFYARYAHLKRSDPPASTEAFIHFVAGRISFALRRCWRPTSWAQRTSCPGSKRL